VRGVVQGNQIRLFVVRASRPHHNIQSPCATAFSVCVHLCHLWRGFCFLFLRTMTMINPGGGFNSWPAFG